LSDEVSESHSVSVAIVMAGVVAIASKVERHLIDPSKYPKTPFDIATVQMSLCHEDQFVLLSVMCGVETE